MILILSWLINCQTQALHYLDSNDLRGFTDFINSEDVEAGGEDRDHWINAPVDDDGATLLEVAIKEKKAKFVETLLAAGARPDLVSATSGMKIKTCQ